MSKLLRYKKPVAVKLPRTLDSKNSNNPNKPAPKTKSTILSDSDDDDFSVPFPPRSRTVKQVTATHSENIPSSHKNIGKKSKETHSSRSIVDSLDSSCSISKYFPSKEKDVAVIGKRNHLLESPSPKSECEAGITDVPKKSSSKTNEAHGAEGYKPEEADTKPPEPSVAAAAATENTDDSNKVVCPFCWKKLSDKLTGTTHVKACAKNLPTTQIFEAIELQEKQIKEWERLGIAYPGFVGGSSATTRKPRAPRPTTRKKKQDPELELAIALSESLHEEVQRRTEKENEFIISNGLEKDIQITELVESKIKKQESKSAAETIFSPPLHPPVRIPSKTRRGHKKNLNELPLYKSSETERKASVERKLNGIFDENENLAKEMKNEISIRDPIPIGVLKLPKNLAALKPTSQKTSLWNLASHYDEPIGNEDAVSNHNSFVIPAILENKQRESSFEMSFKKPVNPEYSGTPSKPTSKVDKEEEVIRRQLSRESRQKRQQMATSSQFQSSSALDKKEMHAMQMQDTQSLTTLTQDVNTPASQQLVKDLVSMYVSKEDADLTVYSREEKPIKCHKLIVKARCRLLLNEIAHETFKGMTRDVIPLTCYSHNAVKAFVKFLYCGQVKLASSVLSKQDMEDLADLGTKYRIHIPVIPESNKSEENEPKKSSLPTTDSNHKETTTALRKKCDRNRSVAAAASRRSVDLFSNNDDDDNAENDDTMTSKTQSVKITVNNSPESKPSTKYDHVSATQSTEVVSVPVENTPAQSTEAEDNLFEKSDGNSSEFDGSVDLFGDDDFENELEDNPESIEKVDDNKNTEIVINKRDEHILPSSENGILEDELNTQVGSAAAILLSPKPYSYTNNKRTRSMSPVTFHSTSSYSASQLADFVDDHMWDGDSQSAESVSTRSQANKKHKLDLVNTDNEKTFDGNDSVLFLCSSFPGENVSVIANDNYISSKSDKKRYSESPVVKNSPVVLNQNPFTIHSSTPLLITSSQNTHPQINPNPNSLPNVLQTNNDNDSEDPFAIDDPCFMNIPSMLLANDSPIIPNNITPVNVSRRKSQNNRPLRQHHLTQNVQLRKSSSVSDQDRLVSNDDKEVTNKRNQKQKKSKNISFSQQPSSSNSATNNNQDKNTTSPVVNNAGTSTSNGLNYSTIDTPLLKKELKRYGLKPLPRSKAKVILRHIDKETQKQNN